jgi:hypothetical protein
MDIWYQHIIYYFHNSMFKIFLGCAANIHTCLSHERTSSNMNMLVIFCKLFVMVSQYFHDIWL